MVVLSKTNKPLTEQLARKQTSPPRQPHTNHRPVGPEGRGQPPGQRNCSAGMVPSPSNENRLRQKESGQLCRSSGASVAIPSNSVPVATSSDDVHAPSFSNTVPVAASSSSVGPSVPVHQRMPSIRPNAMRNREKLLEVLQRYEDRIKLRQEAVPQRVIANEPVAAILNMMAPATSVQMPVNPMYMHVLDISAAVSGRCVTWIPLNPNCDDNAPEETIFYSLIEGRGELIMFGGIQTSTDLGSMQRGLDVKQQTVSNSVHFLTTEHVLR